MSAGGWYWLAEPRPPGQSNTIRGVIYCVVPEALEEELFDKLTRYYADDPNVAVIVDRRHGSRRDRATGGGQRELRDRRRLRVPGELPELTGD
jgi:hypothetical protein